MLRRTPMPRGQGFKRPELVRPPMAPLTPITRGVVVLCNEMGLASPKENVLSSSTYEAAVRRLPCYRCGVVGFTQFCHSDMDKGTGIKTDVRRGWPGCRTREGIPGCHFFVGSTGSMKREERRAFEDQAAAHTRAEVRARGWWPATLPYWLDDELANLQQKEPPAPSIRAQLAMHLGAKS